MNDIKNFQIGKAYYTIENEEGSIIKIEVNYGENSFKSDVLKRGGNLERLKKQAGAIAKDLLARKAQKNLNFKLLQLKV